MAGLLELSVLIGQQLALEVSQYYFIIIFLSFTECIAQGAPIVIDGGKVEEIDTAILQLLASVWMTGAKQGVECRWRAASEALRRIAKLIGVAELLNLDGVETVHEHAVV